MSNRGRGQIWRYPINQAVFAGPALFHHVKITAKAWAWVEIQMLNQMGELQKYDWATIPEKTQRVTVSLLNLELSFLLSFSANNIQEINLSCDEYVLQWWILQSQNITAPRGSGSIAFRTRSDRCRWKNQMEKEKGSNMMKGEKMEPHTSRHGHRDHISSDPSTPPPFSVAWYRISNESRFIDLESRGEIYYLALEWESVAHKYSLNMHTNTHITCAQIHLRMRQTQECGITRALHCRL